jgi:zinc transport system substrate-binding protein
MKIGRWSALAAAALAGCAKDAPAPPEAERAAKKPPLTIYADNYPMQYFTERIAGERAHVILPVAPNRDPAYWKPKDEDVARMQSADLVVLTGAGYAKWYDKVTLPTDKTVDTARAFQDRYITIPDAVVHSHGPEGEHSHAGLAANSWTDPELAILHARAIAQALREKRPEDAEAFDANLAALEADLKALGEELRALAAQRNEPLLASHPVYDYLARYCGWNLKSVHWEPDENPSEEEWKGLEKLLETHAARWMIWEAPPLEEIAQRLHGLGVNSVVFDCCPNRPASGDYLSVMAGNLQELRKIYEYEPDGENSPAP